MELEKQSVWLSNDVKSSQSSLDKTPILVNGHKPIVNPLYDDDEFDVDTETPFLAALSTAEVTKLDKNTEGEVGGNGNNIQTMEDGEIPENANDEMVFNDRKARRGASKSSKHDEKSRGAKESRPLKSNNYSPEQRSSCGRFRGERERSSSFVDRDKNKRMKTVDATMTRESMNREKRETKREKRDRRDGRNRKSDSKLRETNRRQATPRDISVVSPVAINKNMRYTKCLPPIAYADNGWRPKHGNENSNRTKLNASDVISDADGKNTRKFESKNEEKPSKRSRNRSRSKTKSKSPITKAPKSSGEKSSNDSVASVTVNDDSKDERKDRTEAKQSDRLEWKDVQRKSTVANDLPEAMIEDSQSREEFHTIPLNLNISKQKHHFESRTNDKSPPKHQLEDVRGDENIKTTNTSKTLDDVNKSAKSAKGSKRKNQSNIALFYDEYDESMLSVQAYENGDVAKESNESANNSIQAADVEVKIELQNIELEPSPLPSDSERVQKVVAIDSLPPETHSSIEKCATESNEVKMNIKIQSIHQAEDPLADELTNSESNVKSPQIILHADEFVTESGAKIEKSNADTGDETNSKSTEPLPASKRKRSVSSSSWSSSSSTSTSTSSDTSSSSTSSDDDSSSSSSSDSNSSSSDDDSETSSNSSSNGKQSRTSVEKEIIVASPTTEPPSVPIAVEQEIKMQDRNLDELTSKALQTLGINLDDGLLNDTNDLLLKVESFKQIMEKRKLKQKNAAKLSGTEQKSTVADDTAIADPNRSSIQLKVNRRSVSATSIFDNEIEHGRDKQSGKSNSLSVGSTKEADSSDDSKRSSHRNRDAVRKSRGEGERSRRHSADRYRKRSDDDRKKSSSHHARKSSRLRSRSRSPHSNKYAASRNHDRRSSSRSRRMSRERHGSNDHGSKRSRNRTDRFERNERQSSFTPPPRLQRRSTSRNRSLTSSIESRRRSLSPERPYKQNMSPPPSRHRYDRRSPFLCSCSPNRCICLHRNGEHLSRNAAAASRGPRTPPNTPPSENIALYDRYGDRGDIRLYADPRLSPDVNHFTGCEPNVHARLPLPLAGSLYPTGSAPDAAYTPGAGATYGHFRSAPITVTQRHGAYSAPIHPPAMNHSHAPVLGSGDGYYYQTMFLPSPMIPSIEQQHSMQSHRSFAPYASQPQYGNIPMNSMQMKRPPMRKPERKSTIVQKGNVLEIVPGLELQQDVANAAPTESNVDLMPKVETSPISDEQIVQMERLKRKKERQQKRLAKEKRKEFVINEIKRLSQQFIVGADGKMIKAGELLKTSSFGKYVNGSPKPETNSNDQNDAATSPQPVQLYDYDVNAKAGKSIIANADPSNRDMTTYRKKNVVFADGILPGEGTSASENSSDGDEFSTKRAIARSKNKKRNARSSANSISANDVNSAIDKENSDEEKLSLKSDVIGRKEEADENFVPAPPDGSPTPHLKQPRLKCPEKFIVNQLIYFHYNQYEHSMYVSPYPNPTHAAPAAKPMQSAIPTVITTQPTYAYNKHKVQMDSPKEMKVVSRTPLSVQQKQFHSTESNLIVVLQSNSPTMNYSTNESTATNYGTSPMPYMSHAHQLASSQQPIPTHYTSQSPTQIYRAHTPIVAHQSYQMATPTQNYMQSSQLANNVYPTSI